MKETTKAGAGNLRRIGLAAGLAAAMLSLAVAASAEPHRHHRRTSAYGDSPAYWGVERRLRTFRDCCGWRWTRLDSGKASIPQLNPRLRARSDGRLLEEVGSPPPQPDVWVIWPDGASAAPVTVLPWGFLKWRPWRHHSMRGAAPRRSGGAGAFPRRGR